MVRSPMATRRPMRSNTNASTSPAGQFNVLVLVLLCLAILYNVGHQTTRGRLQSSLRSRLPPYHYKLNGFYSASRIERYALEHSVELGFTKTSPPAKGCTMWTDSSRTIFEYLENFLQEMDDYNILAELHQGSPVSDVRKVLEATREGDGAGAGSNNSTSICRKLELHTHGLGGIFTSGSLSRTPKGLVEPIAPPFRDARFCHDHTQKLSRNYLVHDFATYCRQLQPTSRIILLDLTTATKQGDTTAVISEAPLLLAQWYAKFGLPLDRIYSFYYPETGHRTDTPPSLADNFEGTHHWVAVQDGNSDPAVTYEAFVDTLQSFSPEDLVLVHIDSTISEDETSEGSFMASFQAASLKQLLHQPGLAQLVDALYLKHPVALAETPLASTGTGGGHDSRSIDTVLTSMQLFSALRQQGIPTHVWI